MMDSPDQLAQQPPKASSHVSLGSVVLVLTSWLVISGFSLQEATTATAVILGVSACGLVIVLLLGRQLVAEGDVWLWLVGPCLGLGSMVLLILRMFTTEQIFLVVFAVSSMAALVFCAKETRLLFVAKSSGGQSGNLGSSFIIWTLTGVTLIAPVRLEEGWEWVVPIVAVSLVVMFSVSWLKSRFIRSQQLIGMFVISSVVIWAVVRRPEWWWRHAAGVPFDETILEAVSDGVVRWGPSTFPLFHGFDNWPSIGYHYLLFLVVGLINRVADPKTYQTLAVARPIFIGFSFVCTTLLFVKHLLREVNLLRVLRARNLVIIAPFLLSLNVGNSPSMWFGTSVFLGTLLFIFKMGDMSKSVGLLTILGLAVVTLAFSKGVLVWGPPLILAILALFDWRSYRSMAATAVISFLAVSAWFHSVSPAAQSFVFTFWPKRVFETPFAFDVYTTLLVVSTIIAPMAFGLACSLVVITRSQPRSMIRRLSFALLAAQAVGGAARLFVTSTGPDHSGLLSAAGGLSGLLMFLLVLGVMPDSQMRVKWSLGLASILVLAILATVPRLESRSLTPNLVVLVFTSAGLLAIRKLRRSGFVRGIGMPELAQSVTILVLPLLFVASYVRQEYPNFPQYERQRTERDSEDWYGTADLRELAVHVKAQTDTSSLFAYTTCGQKRIQECEPNYLPAVLLERRFLALNPLPFDRESYDSQTWQDIEASQSLGSSDPLRSLEYLRGRGVDWLVVDLERVSGGWLKALTGAGAMETFRNSGYVVLRL